MEFQFEKHSNGERKIYVQKKNGIHNNIDVANMKKEDYAQVYAQCSPGF